jgi:hypothetical protein
LLLQLLRRKNKQKATYSGKNLPLLKIMPFFIPIIFIFAQFQTRTQQPVGISDPAIASSTGKIFTTLFFNHFLHWHLSPTC